MVYFTTRPGNADRSMHSWTFEPDTMRIVTDGLCVQLTPKAAAVLDCLLRHRGETVSRETLLYEVWPGLNVTKDLVREYVFDLRQALEDDAQNPSYIETIRGKGFRLFGPVHRRHPDDGSEKNTDHSPEIRATVAVMRPSRPKGDWDWQQFADGVAWDIITDLSRHHDIAVISQQAAFASDRTRDPRDIASDIGADYLLESAFIIHDGVVRASFHLVDGTTARQVWAQRFDHAFEELLSLSDKIVDAVVSALVGWHGEIHRAEFKSISARQSAELNAFEHFIRGCDLDMRLDEPGIRRSLAHLDRSLELDPRFARCWVVKSAMLQSAIDIFPEPELALMEQSSEAIERAYFLDPQDPTTLSLYALKRARDGDLTGAAEATRRAADAAGTDADAAMTISTSLALVCGDFDGAGLFLDRAFSLNPTPPGWYRFVEARVAYFVGQYDRTIAASNAGTEHVSGLAYRCLAFARLGDRDAALNAYADLIDRFARFDFHRYARRFPISHPDALGQFRAGTGLLQEFIPWEEKTGLLGGSKN